MNVTGVAIELSTTCAKCQAPLLLNGASESALCDTCQTPMATPPELWQKLLGDAVGEAITLEKDEGRPRTIMTGGMTLKLMVGRQDPRCPCKTPFDPETLPRALGAGKLHCAECGKPSVVRAAPAWMKTIHPAITMVVGETMGADKARAVEAKDLRFHCYHCGGALPIDGSTRSVACTYCKNPVMVPDDIWLRLHPARTVDRWFLVLAIDLAHAAGVLPENVDDFCDVTGEPGGNMVIAYLDNHKGKAGHPSRIALVTRDGTYGWLQDGVEFSDDAKLFTCPADGSFYLVEPRTPGFARQFDPRTGAPIRTLPSPTEDSPAGSLNVHGLDALAIDWDGSFVVLRDWSDTNERALRRFAPDGHRVPIWPGTKHPPKEDVETPEWTKLPSKPLRPPSSALIGFGWDGAFYMVDRYGKFVAKYTRDGQLLGVAPLPPSTISRVHGFSTARDGTMSILFEHEIKLGDSDWVHLGRLLPDGRFFLALGPHMGEGAPMLGKYTSILKGAPDGTLFLARDVDDLRIVAPDGRIAWLSNASRRQDESNQKDLAEARRGKRLVADRD